MEKDVFEPIKSMLNRAYNQALDDFRKLANENLYDDEKGDFAITDSSIDEIIGQLRKWGIMVKYWYIGKHICIDIDTNYWGISVGISTDSKCINLDILCLSIAVWK